MAFLRVRFFKALPINDQPLDCMRRAQRMIGAEGELTVPLGSPFQREIPASNTNAIAVSGESACDKRVVRR